VKFRSTGSTLQTDYELPFAHITSYTAFRRTATAYHSDGDYTTISIPAQGGVNLFVHASERQISQELDFTSTHAGPLQWMAGGSYNNELTKYLSNLNGTQSVTQKTLTNNFSAFAELTYSITDQLSVIGGARYSVEKKEMTTWGPGTRNPYDGVQIQAQKTWPSTTPRAVIKYKFDDRTNVYVSYSKGFKSGGFNPSAPPAVQVPFNPEKLTAFEGGVKTTAIHNLRLEAAAFHYDYNDVQVQTQVTSPIPGAPTTNTYNAAQAKLYGGEFSADWTPVEHLNLGAGVSYTHGRYTKFPSATVTTPTAGNNGNITSVKDISGYHMLKVPAWTANLSATYRQVMNSGLIEYTANGYYSSGFYGDLGNRLKQKPYRVLNTQISWSPTNERFKISFWVKNLTNTVYDIWLTDSPTTDRDILAPPRAFGGTISLNF
jgi:iron complex outermembrane receptor protein